MSKPEPLIPKDQGALDLVYRLKRVRYRGPSHLVIVTQNQNGPCPLIALCNVLLLRRLISLPSDSETASFDDLVGILADYLLEIQAGDPQQELTFQKSTNEALTLLPNLQVGLDVNVYFDRCSGFEYTSNTRIFDLFDFKMYHGWVCDSADANTYRIIANDLKSYNRVVEAVVASNVDATIETANDRTADAEKERQKMIGSVCQTFLEDTASQLTEIGLEMLAFEIPALSPQVFFRNNHFSTILKTEDSKLWMLVTDQGYADEAGVVWESIDITGDSILVNDQFHPSQNDNADMALAQELQERDDFEVANRIAREDAQIDETRARNETEKQARREAASRPTRPGPSIHPHPHLPSKNCSIQ